MRPGIFVVILSCIFVPSLVQASSVTISIANSGSDVLTSVLAVVKETPGSTAHDASAGTTSTDETGSSAGNSGSNSSEPAMEQEAAATSNLLSSAVLAGGSEDVTIPTPDNQCLFNFTFSFESGRSLARPDVDVCQLDGLVVE